MKKILKTEIKISDTDKLNVVSKKIIEKSISDVEKITEMKDDNQVHSIQSTEINIDTNKLYKYTILLKSELRYKARLVFNTYGGVYADVDLRKGSIGKATAFANGVGKSSSIKRLGNNWFECSIIGKFSPDHCSGYIKLELLDDLGNRKYCGDGKSGIYVANATLTEV